MKIHLKSKYVCDDTNTSRLSLFSTFPSSSKSFVKENRYALRSNERGSIRWLTGVVIFFVILTGTILISNRAKQTGKGDSPGKKTEISEKIPAASDNATATQDNKQDSPSVARIS